MTSLRPVQLASDLDALYVITHDCEAAVVDEPDTTHADVEEMFTSPQADLVDGARVAVDDEGTALGFVAVYYDRAAHEVTADAYVAPTAADSVWDVLLDHASAYGAARVAAVDPDEAGQWTMNAASYVQDQRYASALRRQRLEVVRRFHTMGISIDAAAPPRVATPPAGVTLVIAGEDEALLRTAIEVANIAFRDHWGHVDHGFDEEMAWFRNRSFDPTQWWIAMADDTAVGVCLGNDHLAELNWSYISTLGVLEAHRGRGIARFLLETAFADAHARGRTGVKLGVDSENATGAPALYTAVGMRALEAIDAWRRPILTAAAR